MLITKLMVWGPLVEEKEGILAWTFYCGRWSCFCTGCLVWSLPQLVSRYAKPSITEKQLMWEVKLLKSHRKRSLNVNQTSCIPNSAFFQLFEHCHKYWILEKTHVYWWIIYVPKTNLDFIPSLKSWRSNCFLAFWLRPSEEFKIPNLFPSVSALC
jgi:hypothetical protein